MSASYGTRQRVSLPVHNDLEDLLMWRDPRKTAAVFGAFTLDYFLLEWSKYSLLTLTANVLLIGVVGSFLWSNLAMLLNRAPLPIPAIIQHGVSEQQSRAYAEQFTTAINKLLGFTRRVITGNDVVLSVEAALGLYVIAKTGMYFTTLGLAYTVIVLLFTLPKIYELRKHDIDSAASQVANKTKQSYSQYAAPYINKIPKASTATSSGYNRQSSKSTADSGYNKAGNYSSTADSASVAPAGPLASGAQDFKRTY